jgi:hypothetical protein
MLDFKRSVDATGVEMLHHILPYLVVLSAAGVALLIRR